MFKQFSTFLHLSWTFYAAVWGIIIGIIIGITCQLTVFRSYLWLAIGLLSLILSLLFPSRLTFVVALLSGLLIGTFRASFQFDGHEYLQSQLEQKVLLRGQLTDDPDLSQGTATIRLQQLSLCPAATPPAELSQTDMISEHADPCVDVAGQAYVTLSSSTTLERSDLVTLEGKLRPGFGTFVAKMSRPELIHLERSETGDIFARFKHWFANCLRAFIPSPENDLGLGYLMGMKSGLSEDFSEALRTVGMTHVVVASGAHLAILTGAAKRLFGKISRFAGLLFSLLMIAAFVLVVGFTPSMTRAALVASLSLLFGYVGRKFTPFRLISFVAMITLLLSPLNVFHLGWQLSFASFFGILIFAPRLQRTFYGGKTPPWLATMLITSVATCLTCAPILIFNFGSLSLLSLIANLIILPTLPYAMLLMLLTGITSFLPPLATLLALPTRLLLDLHIFVVNYLSQQTMFVLELPSAQPLIFLLYLPLALFLIWPTLRLSSFFKRLCYNESMQIDSEADMIALGRFFAEHIQAPAIFELVGDVGTGKTTFTRGLASGLDIAEPVTSPSFTISKRYASPSGELIHYDFYRLGDPGIMRDELAEAIAEARNIIVVEWGGDVADLLPDSKYHLEFRLNEDGSRTVRANPPAQAILDLYRQEHRS